MSGNWFKPDVMEGLMSKDDILIRDKFVTEYIVDYDGFNACLRMGFLHSVASTYAEQFLKEGYVQRGIAAAQRQQVRDPSDQLKADRELTLNTLREAMQRGPYASRVAAAAKFSAILGLDAPIKTQNEHMHRGGVMRVPEIANVEDWEAEAVSSQEKLVEETQNL